MLNPTSLASKKHATLTVLPDGSVLASGDKPNNDVYTVELTADLKGITAIRLEVLTDPSLPEGGPGRAPLFQVGDFLLTEFQLAAGGRPVRWSRATEDYAAKGHPAAQAIDGVSDTGWSINGGTGRNHAAVFELAEDVGDGGRTRLVVTMHQEYIHQMTIGRFRLSATTDPRPVRASGVPADVEAILLLSRADRKDSQSRRLERYYLTVAPELAKAREPIAALRRSMPRFPTTMVMQERRSEHARTTHVHRRGEFLKPAEPVEPGVPAVLHPLPSGASQPADAGALAGRSREPAGRPGGDEPALAGVFRPGTGQHARGLRHSGLAADAP